MDGIIPLTSAIHQNSRGNFHRIMQSGCTLKQMKFALCAAVMCRRVEFIESLLLKYGAPVTISTLEEGIRSSETIFEILLSHFDGNFECEHSLLHSIASIRSLNSNRFCKILIKHGSDVNLSTRWSSPLTKNLKNSSPLTVAILSGNLEVIDILLSGGADPYRQYATETHPSIEFYRVFNSVPSSPIVSSPSMDAHRQDLFETHPVINLYRPLNYAFNLPSSSIENIVKYAALHVDLKDLKMFLSHFRLGKPRAYMKFAQRCIMEIKIIKKLRLNSKMLNLFNFLISQGSWLKLYLESEEIANRVLELLFITSLPIYKVVILKKFSKKDILSSLVKISLSKWKATCGDKVVVLNSDCLLKIYSFLMKKDLLLMWVAFTML